MDKVAEFYFLTTEDAGIFSWRCAGRVKAAYAQADTIDYWNALAFRLLRMTLDSYIPVARVLPFFLKTNVMQLQSGGFRCGLGPADERFSTGISFLDRGALQLWPTIKEGA